MGNILDACLDALQQHVMLLLHKCYTSRPLRVDRATTTPAMITVGAQPFITNKSIQNGEMTTRNYQRKMVFHGLLQCGTERITVWLGCDDATDAEWQVTSLIKDGALVKLTTIMGFIELLSINSYLKWVVDRS